MPVSPKIRALAVPLALLAAAVFVPAALAQAPTPTPTATPNPVTNDNDRDLAFVIVLFGALALGLVYWFMNQWRQDLRQLMGATLARTGQLPGISYGPQEGGTDGRPRDVREAELDIAGPAQVTVGEPAEYTATDAAAVWTLNPPDAGKLDPTSGEKTKLTATTAGALQLTATADGETKTIVIAALPPVSTTPGALPLIGAGYGGITIAIVAVTVAAALTAVDALPGAALATLLGTVVSYFFVRRENGGS